VSNDKRFVYVIRSERHPDRHYTGITRNVARRIVLHNTARSGHTSSSATWSPARDGRFPSGTSRRSSRTA